MAAAEYRLSNAKRAGRRPARRLVRKVDVEAADAKVDKLKSEAEYAQYQYRLYHASQNRVPARRKNRRNVRSSEVQEAKRERSTSGSRAFAVDL